MSWTFLIAPYAHDATLSLGTKLTSIAYPLMDIGIAACVARLALGPGRRSPSLAFLTAGVICLLGTDSIYGWKLLHGGYTTGGLLDGGWIAFYLLIGTAALHPSSSALVQKAADTQFRLTRRRIASLACCAIITPLGLAIAGLRSSPGIDVTLLAASSGFVFLLVFMRFLDLGNRYEASLLRATVLAEATVHLVAARTGAEIDEVAAAARRRCSEAKAPSASSMEQLPKRISPRRKSATTTGGIRRDHGRTGRPGHPRGNPCAVKRGLPGAPSRRDGRQAPSPEGRGPLQTLVQHSSDAILVVDASGLVDYASPSTRRVLGEQGDLEHCLFSDLVSRGRQAAHRPAPARRRWRKILADARVCADVGSR